MSVQVEQQIELHEDGFTTEVLGKRACELLIGDIMAQKFEAAWSRCLKQLDSNPAMLYTKVPVGNLWLSNWLAEQGWQLTDTNVQLEKTFSQVYGNGPRGVSFRLARDEDEDTVAEIARKSFPCSRWHKDKMIDNDLADEIKEQWARNYWRGKRGTHMVVAQVEDKVVGFNQIIMRDNGVLLIDLIAVDGNYRRRDIGTGLLSYCERNLGEIVRARVGTQLANRASMAMYQRIGYRIVSAKHIWHYHLPGD